MTRVHNTVIAAFGRIFLLLSLALFSRCGYPESFDCPDPGNSNACRGVEIYLPLTSIQEGEKAHAFLLMIHQEGHKSICNDGTVIWGSGDESIVLIDEHGELTGAGPGETVITASWNTYSAVSPIAVKRAVDFTKIQLSEIFYDDTGSDTGVEYIEIRNLNDYECDLTGFFLVDGASGSTRFYLPQGTCIPPGTFLIAAQSRDGFNGRFGFDPHCWGFSFVLNNSGETVFLCFPDGSVRDCVYIEGGATEFLAPPEWCSPEYPAATEGLSIKRAGETDTDTAFDWVEGTPDPGM